MPSIRWQTYLCLDEHSLAFGEALASADPRHRGDKTWVHAMLRELEAQFTAAWVL